MNLSIDQGKVWEIKTWLTFFVKCKMWYAKFWDFRKYVEGEKESRKKGREGGKFGFSSFIRAQNAILGEAPVLQMALSELYDGIIYLIRIKECFNII